VWSAVLLTDGAGSEPVTLSGVTVLPAANPAQVAEAIADMARGPVVVAAPLSLADTAAAALTFLAANWPEVPGARVVSGHAPLAILSALAGAQAQGVTATFAVRLVEELLRHSWSGAWVASLTRLSRPAPTIAQHVRSLLPGAGFVLRQEPSPAVLKAVDGTDVPSAPVGRFLLAEEGVSAHLTEAVAKAGHAVGVRPVTIPGVWTRVYGTSRSAQLALVPADSSVFRFGHEYDCPSCRQPQPEDRCPFCRVRCLSARPEAPRHQAVSATSLPPMSKPAPPPLPHGIAAPQQVSPASERARGYR
jgi:hypothetical protein